jgi:hypothetical protein
MLAAGRLSDQPVYLSTNNGVSWVSLGFSATRYTVHISKSGEVMIFETGANVIEVSNDFGTTFTTFNLNNIITLGTSIAYISRLALSSGGKFITISVYALGVTAGDNPYRILKSSDYGNSFSDITNHVGFPFTGAQQDVSIQDALISGDGKYEIYFNSLGASRYSNDYGKTFSDKAYPLFDWNELGQISEDGQYFMLDSTSSPGRYSTDFGVSTSLGSIANSNTFGLGVSNSGEFSFTGSTSSSTSIKYSNNFFNSFTEVSGAPGVAAPYILVDVS